MTMPTPTIYTKHYRQRLSALNAYIRSLREAGAKVSHARLLPGQGKSEVNITYGGSIETLPIRLDVTLTINPEES